MTKTMPKPSAVPIIDPTPIESTLTLLSDKVVKQLLIMLNRNKAVQMIITHLRNLYIIYTSLSLSFPTTFIVFIRYFSSDFLLLCFIPNSIQSTLFTSAIGENIPAADSILMEYLNTELLRPGTDVQQPPSAKRREPPPDAA